MSFQWNSMKNFALVFVLIAVFAVSLGCGSKSADGGGASSSAGGGKLPVDTDKP
jgi:hypothetical protein